MAYRVIITAPAHEDVLKTYLYYEERQQGLGDRLLNDLNEKYNQISLHPTHYGFIDEDPLKVLRDVRLRKFPCVIVFEIIKNDVVVFALHHLKKHPKNKLPRN